MSHPVLERLDLTLRVCVPAEPVSLAGAWSKTTRRTYATEAQLGTGLGPFTDVVDVRWRGTLTSAGPIGGIAFLVAAGDLYWVKAPDISAALPVEVSLHRYAEIRTGSATFTANMAGAYLPGVPVLLISETEPCTVHEGVVTTGRVSCIAQTNSAAVFVLLFQRGLLKVGRKRLWRVRHEIESSLPEGIRELLTHRRTGSVLSGPEA